MVLDNVSLGKRINELRLSAGLSRRELGEQLNISQQQIQKYEKGQNQVSAVKLAHIADILNVPLSEFYSDDVWKTALPKKGRQQRKLQELYKMLLKLPKPTQNTVITLVSQIVKK